MTAYTATTAPATITGWDLSVAAAYESNGWPCFLSNTIRALAERRFGLHVRKLTAEDVRWIARKVPTTATAYNTDTAVAMLLEFADGMDCAAAPAVPVSLVKPPHLLAIARVRRGLRAARATGNVYAARHLSDNLARRQRGAAAVDTVAAVAADNGWALAWSTYTGGRVAGTSRPNPRAAVDGRALLTVTRDGERLDIVVDARPTSVYGRVATGPVSTANIDTAAWVTAESITELLARPAHADYPASEWVAVVGPDYVERRDYSSPCNYAEYRVEPGVYPVENVDIRYRASVDGVNGADVRRAYYAIATAPSVKFHDYYVNRLGSASSVSENWDESTATTWFSRYAYQLDDNARAASLPEDMTGRVVWMLRDALPAAEVLARLLALGTEPADGGPFAWSGDETRPRG